MLTDIDFITIDKEGYVNTHVLRQAASETMTLKENFNTAMSSYEQKCKAVFDPKLDDICGEYLPMDDVEQLCKDSGLSKRRDSGLTEFNQT